LESIHANNHYIRQGSNTVQVLNNIQWLRENTDFQIVLRSVPQLLSVNNYDQYIRWAADQNLSIQSIPLTAPRYLAVNVLPFELRQKLVDQYQQLKEDLALTNTTKFSTITTGRDTSRLHQQLIRECDMIINLLLSPAPADVELLRKELVSWLIRWDREYALDARNTYPEYREFLDYYGYDV
jgi:hypothetical protein